MKRPSTRTESRANRPLQKHSRPKRLFQAKETNIAEPQPNQLSNKVWNPGLETRTNKIDSGEKNPNFQKLQLSDAEEDGQNPARPKTATNHPEDWMQHHHTTLADLQSTANQRTTVRGWENVRKLGPPEGRSYRNKPTTTTAREVMLVEPNRRAR
jgi:hypothetical protein